MRSVSRFGLLLTVWGGCAAKYEPPADEEVDGAVAEPDAAASDVDAAPGPDAPPPRAYPAGPYGTATGRVIVNLAWQGFRDTGADADHDPFNEAAHTVSLEDYFVGRDPGSRLLIITSSAGWCAACQEEATHMPGMAAEWSPRGVRFLTAMLEDEAGRPCPIAFAREWGLDFDLTTDVVADPQALLDPYYSSNSIPFNLFIETDGMTIVRKMHGWDDDVAEGIFDAYAD